MRNNWTQEELTMLRNNYAAMSKSAICQLIHTHSYGSIKTRARLMGIKRDKCSFSEQEIEYIKANYAMTKNSGLAEVLNCDSIKIFRKASNLGLKKDKQFFMDMGNEITQKGQATRFPKGHIPANKGKKMSEETKTKMTHTFFQKGHIPHNALPDWAEVVDKEGYIMIKLPGTRKVTFKHWWIWEQANGKPSKGYNIQFRDGNRKNCALENLYLISRKEQIHQNTIMRYPVEVRVAIHRINKINKLIQGKNE